MSEEKDLKIKILEYIEAKNPEELYRSTKGIKLPNYEKKEVNYKAHEMKKNGLIDAAVLKHDLGVEKVIPRGLTESGKRVLTKHRRSWWEKLFSFPLYKEKLREEFTTNLAKGTVSILFITIGYILRYLQELFF
jgi:hypothetical protein